MFFFWYIYLGRGAYTRQEICDEGQYKKAAN